MPSGAKKRKAAKKKQEQASSTQINPKSNNHAQRSAEEDAVRDGKVTGLDTDERIEITDSSHDHDKSSSNSSSGSGGSSSSSSDDESHEVKRKDGDKEEETEVVTVPSQPVPVAGDAPFIGSTANAIVENTGLIDSATPTDPNTENIIEISSVDTVLQNEPAAAEVSLTSDESKQASSSTTGSVKKESKCVPEGSKESEVVISHAEEATVRPTHGVAQRTSWLSCCGLFDVVTGSSR